MEAIVELFWRASDQRCVCRVKLYGEPLPRVIHPYGVFKSLGNKIMVVCWQEAGFTKAGAQAGYRNLLLEKFEEVEVMEKNFIKRSDFIPQDGQYQEWVYHIE
jgi:hypothetical protein